VGTWGKYGGQPAEREAPPRWPRGRRGESRACRGSRPRGVGVGDIELVDRLLEGEKGVGVELLARHVEVEVCMPSQGTSNSRAGLAASFSSKATPTCTTKDIASTPV